MTADVSVMQQALPRNSIPGPPHTLIRDSLQLAPVLIGLGAVVIGAVIFKLWSNKQRKQAAKKTLLDPAEKYMLPLLEKEEISHDTRRFRFGLPSSEHVLGLPIGQHVNLIAQINNETVIRAYTPVSSDETDHGYVDLVVKVYHRDVHPKFPDGGKMTQHLDAMKVGDSIAFRGPSGRIQYQGSGQFSVKAVKQPSTIVRASAVCMIAGGTGITPMLQLIRNVLVTNAGRDQTRLALLYANQTEDDILLRRELDQLAKDYSDQFSVWYTVDRAPEGWTFSQGFINEDMIRNHLLPPSADTIVLMCGPPPMLKFACHPSLDSVGHGTEMRFAY